jgi:predicted MFS family arabinose efflux permease
LLIGLIAGGLIFVVALFLKKVPRAAAVPPRDQARAVHAPGFTLKEAAKTRSFWFLATVYMMVSFSFYLVLTHIVPHAGDLGINAARAAIIVSIMGGSTIPGRLVIGLASDRLSRKKLAIFCAFVEVAGMVWLTQSNSLWMFCVFAVVFGFAFGGISNLMATLIGDTFGMTNLGAISGTLVVGFSFGAAIGPAVGGIIFDATNSYNIAFLVGVCAACLAVVSLTLTRREKKRV